MTDQYWTGQQWAVSQAWPQAASMAQDPGHTYDRWEMSTGAPPVPAMTGWEHSQQPDYGPQPDYGHMQQQPDYRPQPDYGQQPEYGHVDKRARTDPLAPQFVDQSQLFSQQTGRHSVPQHGRSAARARHGHGSSRHHRQPQQPQPDLQALPSNHNYLEAYPAAKDLIQQFKNRGTEQSPLAVVNEYAARMMQQVVFDFRQESLSGGFTVEARLMGKRSPEPIEVGRGRARNKQIGKQVAAAALLEVLLESAVDPQSLLDPNAGQKAPKKWEPPQKPGLGLDPSVLGRGGGAFRRFGAPSRPPRFVRGGTIVPAAGGFEYFPKGMPPGGSSHSQRPSQREQEGESSHHRHDGHHHRYSSSRDHDPRRHQHSGSAAAPRHGGSAALQAAHPLQQYGSGGSPAGLGSGASLGSAQHGHPGLGAWVGAGWPHAGLGAPQPYANGVAHGLQYPTYSTVP